MKILLIEDNEDVANFIRYTYPDESFHVCATLQDSIEWLKTHRPQLVFVDLGLPDSRGLDTLRALQEFNIPKVIITGQSSVSWEAGELGAVDYILKNSDGGNEEFLTRIGFNIEKHKPRARRLAPDVFEQLKSCLAFSHEKLTVVG